MNSIARELSEALAEAGTIDNATEFRENLKAKQRKKRQRKRKGKLNPLFNPKSNA